MTVTLSTDGDVVHNSGDFTVIGGSYGEDWLYYGRALHIVGTTPLTVKNTAATGTASDSILVDPGEGKTAQVTFNGVRINAQGVPTFLVKGAVGVASGTLDLTLIDGSTNTL
jgi:hypothetical protein